MTDYIWRYLSDWKTDYLFKQQKIYIPQIYEFEKEYDEGFFTIEEKRLITTKYKKPEFIFKKVKSYKKRSYVSCWCKTQSESMKMWKNYLESNGNGISIKTSKTKLKKLIKGYLPDSDTNFRNVNYVDPVKADLQTANVIDLYSRKIDEDRFENEYRALIQLHDQKEYPNKIEIPIRLDHFIEEIIISPFSDKSYKKKLQETISKVSTLTPIESAIN